MATYDITAPDGQKYRINAPDTASESEVMAYAQKSFKSAEPAPETTLGQDIKQGAGNLLAGAVRGAGSIGATLLSPIDIAKDAIAGKGLSLESNRARRQGMDDALQSMGAEPDSWMYKGGKLGGEIAGTAGMGGAIANAGARVPMLANNAAPLLQAIRTGGLSAGGAGIGVRSAGGALTGAASAGLVNPEDAGMGAAIGGALPPILKGAGAIGSAIGRGVVSMLTPQQQIMVAKIAKQTGRTVDDVLAAVQKQGPSILGIKPTVPQILQDDAISQLQRSVINAGDKSIMAREAAQNAERVAGLGRVAPVFGTVNEAADNAGNLIGNFAKSARANKTDEVRQLFEAVDPFNDTAIKLPIDAMKAQKAKFMGPGTFGKGTAANSALSTAEDIGTTVLPAIKPISKASAKTQSLEQAVRAAGGLRGSGGELADLGIKQSGTTGLINNKTGKPADLLAEEMHARGFLPDNDPATLFEYLRNGRGRKVFASDVNENAMQLAMERSAGDLPGERVIEKAIPFAHVQNMRSSLNEAWKDASMRGRNQEAAALKGMISEIDNKVSKVAGGNGDVGEAFPSDIVESWKKALLAHAEKKARFDTGPQARMFRQGGDGQTAIQGAEIPREFFNNRASQIDDSLAFKRLAENNPQLSQALKSYAMTDAAQQTTKDGMLSATKLTQWVNSRHGALRETMSEQDRALLNEIVAGVRAADKAATGGMSKGSNTAQNLEAAKRLLGNGLLDSSASNILFNRIPIVGNFTGPMLESLRKTAQATKAERLGGLLSDPDAFAAELQKFIARQQPGRLQGLLSDPRFTAINQTGYRVAPLLAGD